MFTSNYLEIFTTNKLFQAFSIMQLSCTLGKRKIWIYLNPCFLTVKVVQEFDGQLPNEQEVSILFEKP